MSLKPPKKSDLNKTWMKKRLDRAIKIQPEYQLIVAEGKNTEPAYFGAIQEIVNRQYPQKVQLNVSGEGKNTISLFEQAKMLAQDSSNIYRHVWVVYDTDDFSVDHIDRVLRLCQENSTEETQFHDIWSNQCIELWFLLHFSFMHSDLHRREYWPKLSEYMKKLGAGEYEKNRKDMYQILRPYMERAIENAKKLDALNEGKTASQAAPGTKVYELIEKLKPYLEEERQ